MISDLARNWSFSSEGSIGREMLRAVRDAR